MMLRHIQWVSDLIDEDSKEWKWDLVSQCFLPQDIDVILSIPLSVTGARDRVIWDENKNERFTVKNAYILAHEEQWDIVMGEGSNQSPMKQTWKKLWQMNVPNKVRHFVLKACRNILATKENLQQRNITKDSTCEVCGAQGRTQDFKLGGARDKQKKISNMHPYIINKLSTKKKTQKSLFFNILIYNHLLTKTKNTKYYCFFIQSSMKKELNALSNLQNHL